MVEWHSLHTSSFVVKVAIIFPSFCVKIECPVQSSSRKVLLFTLGKSMIFLTSQLLCFCMYHWFRYISQLKQACPVQGNFLNPELFRCTYILDMIKPFDLSWCCNAKEFPLLCRATLDYFLRCTESNPKFLATICSHFKTQLVFPLFSFWLLCNCTTHSAVLIPSSSPGFCLPCHFSVAMVTLQTHKITGMEGNWLFFFCRSISFSKDTLLIQWNFLTSTHRI